MNDAVWFGKPVWAMIFFIGILLTADYLLAVNYSAQIDWQSVVTLLILVVVQKLSLIISLSLCLFFAPWYWSKKVVGDHPNFELLKYLLLVGIPLALIMSVTHYFYAESVLPFLISGVLLVLSLVVMALSIPRFKNALFAILLLWISVDIIHGILLPDMMSWLAVTAAMLFMSAICLHLFLKKMDQEIVLLVSLLTVFAVTMPCLSQASHVAVGNANDKSSAEMPIKADKHAPRMASAGYQA